MTDEEIKILQTELDTLKAEALENTKKLQELEAERDSLKTENEKLIRDSQELQDDNKKLKETNFTLARHLDVSKEQKSAEDILNDMFK